MYHALNMVLGLQRSLRHSAYPEDTHSYQTSVSAFPSYTNSSLSVVSLVLAAFDSMYPYSNFNSFVPFV